MASVWYQLTKNYQEQLGSEYDLSGEINELYQYYKNKLENLKKTSLNDAKTAGIIQKVQADIDVFTNKNCQKNDYDKLLQKRENFINDEAFFLYHLLRESVEYTFKNIENISENEISSRLLNAIEIKSSEPGFINHKLHIDRIYANIEESTQELESGTDYVIIHIDQKIKSIWFQAKRGTSKTDPLKFSYEQKNISTGKMQLDQLLLMNQPNKSISLYIIYPESNKFFPCISATSIGNHNERPVNFETLKYDYSKFEEHATSFFINQKNGFENVNEFIMFLLNSEIENKLNIATITPKNKNNLVLQIQQALTLKNHAIIKLKELIKAEIRKYIAEAFGAPNDKNITYKNLKAMSEMDELKNNAKQLLEIADFTQNLQSKCVNAISKKNSRAVRNIKSIIIDTENNYNSNLECKISQINKNLPAIANMLTNEIPGYCIYKSISHSNQL